MKCPISFFPSRDLQLPPHSLQTLMSQLLSAPETVLHKQRHLLKKGISIEGTNNIALLNTFISDMTRYGLEKNFQETLHYMDDLIDENLMLQLSQIGDPSITSVNVLAEKNALWQKRCECPTALERIGRIWKKYRSDVLHFIPTQIDLILGAYNFIDFRKSCSTLWEKNNYLDLIAKVALVGWGAFRCLCSFFSVQLSAAQRAYSATAGVFLSISVFLSIYSRILRPMPDEFVFYKNLDKAWQKGLIPQRGERCLELNKTIASLEGGRNVRLVGKAGEGKTSLIEHLVKMHDEKKLPQELQKRAIFELKCGELISNPYGYGVMIEKARSIIDGFEDKMLIVCDEFGRLIRNEDALQEFKKHYLGRENQLTCVVALSESDEAKLKEIDKDGSIRGRLEKVHIKPASDAQIEAMLLSKMQSEMQDVPISPEVVSYIVEITKEENITGRARRAISLLEMTYNRVKATYLGFFEPSLSQREKKWKFLSLQLRRQMGESISANTLKQRHTYEQESEATKNAALEALKAVYTLKKTQSDIAKYRADLTHKIADKKQNSLPRERAQYLWLECYAAPLIDELLQNKVDEVKKDYPYLTVEVNQALVKRIYKEWKKT